MPITPDTSELIAGYATFATIKVVGYCTLTFVMDRVYKKPIWFFILSGISRTLIGLVFGGIYSFIGGLLLGISGFTLAPLFLLGLLLLRLLEWWLVVWLFYDRSLTEKSKDWVWVGIGVAWSFVLDIPAFLGLVVKSGLFIC
jgi:hypothetical protein